MEKEKLIQELLDYLEEQTKYGDVMRDPDYCATNIKSMLDKIKEAKV